MGLGMQMIAWDERFCGLLAERGYRVIRFDNRDAGHSTKFDRAGVPSRAAMISGTGHPPYLLSDMAADTIALLDHLGIERAHVAGVSMGGMIAQEIAIRHPGRVAVDGFDHVDDRQPLASLAEVEGDGDADGEAAGGRRGLHRPAMRTFDVIGSPGQRMDDELLPGADRGLL